MLGKLARKRLDRNNFCLSSRISVEILVFFSFLFRLACKISRTTITNLTPLRFFFTKNLSVSKPVSAKFLGSNICCCILMLWWHWNIAWRGSNLYSKYQFLIVQTSDEPDTVQPTTSSWNILCLSLRLNISFYIFIIALYFTGCIFIIHKLCSRNKNLSRTKCIWCICFNLEYDLLLSWIVNIEKSSDVWKNQITYQSPNHRSTEKKTHSTGPLIHFHKIVNANHLKVLNW